MKKISASKFYCGKSTRPGGKSKPMEVAVGKDKQLKKKKMKKM